MDFNDPTNYYDVLDIRPNASPSEVREAYYRAKSAYNKDSVALYSLIAPGEREDILTRIEEAYEILSNEDKRRRYDANHGVLETEEEGSEEIESSPSVVSIDRVPPMEAFGEEESEEFLVAPSTDFVQPPQSSVQPREPIPPARRHVSSPQAQPPSHSPPLTKSESTEVALAREIATENDWRGSFIRHVRESLKISIEEMSSNTKLSKTYIIAIEEENFTRLPAPVFVRGFLIQIARILRFPQEKFLNSYLERFKSAKSDP
jgi:curved DNA-binding protein CbpA